MNCPNCKTDIELTWTRYLKSPLGRFTCQKCATKFKLKKRAIWYAWYTLWFVCYASTATFVPMHYYGTYNIWAMFIAISIPMLAVGLIIDRKSMSTFEAKII